MKKKIDQITIIGKRWFERSGGNTYHSCEVFVNGQSIGYKPFTYGYEEAYKQTALTILQEAGYFKHTGESLKSGANKDYYEFTMDMRENRNKYVISVSDVSRKKDL